MFGSADDVIWWAVGGQMESFAVRIQTADPHESSILRLLCIEVIQLLFLPSSLSLSLSLYLSKSNTTAGTAPLLNSHPNPNSGFEHIYYG
jgi:hypothetical protein